LVFKSLFSGAKPQQNDSSDTATGLNARDLARQQLMDDIGHFLLGNDLEISEENLTAAFGICSGHDAELARRVTERRAAGQPVTQAWLDEQCRHGEDAVERMADKLERSLETFATTSRNARATAAQYNSEMQVHVDKASEAEEQAEILNLAELARAMLERTKHLEQEMHRSEREAATLRSNLAKARRDADHDHLTGLPNRRAFESLIEQYYREAQASLDALSVAFCDIDNFKSINDTHGHDTGDRVIQAIASSLAKISGDNCHVARHGGEEFVMLFRGSGKKEACQQLDEVREAFSQRNFINRRTDEPIGQITFSGGVADVFAYKSPREALKAADVALYAAKEQGRNRIVAA
tara:strand:+ start:1217 stop:2272 length:1056 start_codon:yes stop_codon:yes gene_type:complete